MTGKDHDIRYADKKGLVTLFDFAVESDAIDNATKNGGSDEEALEGGQLVEGKEPVNRAKLGNNGSSPNA